MNIEIKLGRNHCSAGSDDSSMMTFILIVFFIFIPLISENVTVNCQASNILVEIQKSLFTDTDNDTEFAATDLALNDRDCNATNGSNTFDFDIIHGTCQTALNYSKDGERVFYHNAVFDTKTNADDPEFNIICTYSSKYVKLVFRAHGVGYHKPVPRQAFKRPMGEHYQVFLDRSRKDN